MNTREVKIQVEQEGQVKLLGETGYGLKGNDEVVAFFVDLYDNAVVTYTASPPQGYPTIGLCLDEEDYSVIDTEINFPEYPGWRVHSTRCGKVLSVALIKD